ncbi:hypothetical protein niasHS_012143 [Heterodera schachtii]|uniref:Uncharacterized protein n=1 Tax=Heterodera schachtii TaxID=97005 RepID=A0ABD2IGK4_HETSC
MFLNKFSGREWNAVEQALDELIEQRRQRGALPDVTEWVPPTAVRREEEREEVEGKRMGCGGACLRRASGPSPAGRAAKRMKSPSAAGGATDLSKRVGLRGV